MTNDEVLQRIYALSTEIYAPLLEQSYERMKSISELEHYTSPAAALSIIRNREVWFSNVRHMSDVSEVTAGCQMLSQVLFDNLNQIFSDDPNLRPAVLAAFNRFAEAATRNTYIFSLSEPDPDAPEGRLSMWREYAADGDGLCLVLKRDQFIHLGSLHFPIWWVIVNSESEDAFKARAREQLIRVSQVISAQSQALDGVPLGSIAELVARSFVGLALGHKHKGFQYENEIRLIHIRGDWIEPVAGKMKYDAECIRGVLKPVFKVKLEGFDELPNASLEKMLSRVIVGPSNYADMQIEALKVLLGVNGMPRVEIHETGIPYRGVGR